MAVAGEYVPVQKVGVGIDRSQDWRLGFVPDLTAVSLDVVDFADVRTALGVQTGEPLHVLCDLDMTLRHNYARNLDENVVANLQSHLAAGTISSVHIATNNRDPDVVGFNGKISPSTSVFAPVLNKDWRVVRKQEGEYYRRIVDDLGIAADAVLAVGDKYRRDVLGGNRAGLFTMRVMPLPGPELWFDRLGLRALDNYAGRVGRAALAELVITGQL